MADFFHIQIKSRQAGEKIVRKKKITKRKSRTVKNFSFLRIASSKVPKSRKKLYTVIRKHYSPKKEGQISQTRRQLFSFCFLRCRAEISASWHWQH
jgi:hypothetical protein